MPSAPSNESHFGLLHGSPLKGSHPLRSSPPHLLPLPEASTGPMEPHDPPHEVPDPSPPPSYDPAVQTLALPTAPHPVPSSKGKMEMVRDAVGRWGKRIGEAAKATGDAAGDVWQHLKTAPTVADAAMGIIAQSTKVIAEGGYEKIFRSTFDTLPDEQLKDCFACYLSTSAGPILGILYLSSAKVAFCSDNALSYKVGGRTEWSYYKVVIPLHQLQAVNPSTSKINPAEKYIQVVSIDNHEFWFMSFLNYDGAVKSLLEAPLVGNIEP